MANLAKRGEFNEDFGRRQPRPFKADGAEGKNGLQEMGICRTDCILASWLKLCAQETASANWTHGGSNSSAASLIRGRVIMPPRSQ